ncbi:Uncharacterised protein [Mycobacteroides abscessus subsp. abscessus]|nr:Uncharacterised protein [Mycobacteroides abscessus subsp. abscessus]
MAEGTQAAPVGAEQCFGAVAGHVDAGGAVGGAGLAGEAQVEGLEDLGGVDGLDELRVRRLLEDAGAAAGHVLLLARGQVGRAHEGAGHSRAALADAGAAVDGGREVAAVVGEGEAAVRRHGARGDAAQAKVEGVDAGLELERTARMAGIPGNPGIPRPRAGGGLGLVHGGGEYPGVEEVVRVEDVLDAGEQVEHLGGVHEPQELAAGAAVAVFAGDGAAVGGADAGRGLQERARVGDALRGVERHGEAHVHAAVAEVPVQEAVDVELLHEGGEVAQVRAEVLGRDGRVLEAGPGLLVAAASAVRRGASAQARTVGADPPQGRGLRPRRVHDRVDGCRVGAQGACALQGGGDVFAGGADFDEEPAFARGQGGDGARALVCAHDVDQAAVHALHGEGGVGEQCGHVVGGLDHGAVAEGGEHGRVGQGHEAHGDGQDEDEGAFGAREHGGEVAPTLGGEVLEGVAGDLALEAAELGADGRQVGVDEGGQTRHVAEGGVVAGRGREAPPLPVHAVESDDVIGGAPPGGSVRATRVVGDHAGDRRAVLGGRVGAEAQAVLGGRGLEGGSDAAGFDGGRAGLGVDGDDAVHVPRKIEDEAGADRVGRARGAAASGGEGDAVGAGKVEGRDRLLGRAREGDGQRRDAREAGVGGVARSRAARGVDVDECAQVRQEALAHGASLSRGRASGGGYPVCGWSREAMAGWGARGGVRRCREKGRVEAVGACGPDDYAGSGSSWNSLGKGVTGTGMRSTGGR